MPLACILKCSSLQRASALIGPSKAPDRTDRSAFFVCIALAQNGARYRHIACSGRLVIVGVGFGAAEPLPALSWLQCLHCRSCRSGAVSCCDTEALTPPHVESLANKFQQAWSRVSRCAPGVENAVPDFPRRIVEPTDWVICYGFVSTRYDRRAFGENVIHALALVR